MKRKYHGMPGHFIGARSCCFHLHTSGNGYRVSTVGCYHGAFPHRGRITVGLGRLYETMVFKLDDDGEPVDWTELDMKGYNDEEAAEAGHEALCQKWIDGVEENNEA